MFSERDKMTMPTAHIFLRLPILFIIFNLITTLIPSALCDDDAQYTECRKTYDCGLIKNITYPFWAANSRPHHCGREGYELTCRDNNEYPLIRIEEQDFLVLNISREINIITIARADLWDIPCPSRLVNTTLDYDRFSYVQAVRNLTLFYGCVPQNQSIANNFTCQIEDIQNDLAIYIDDSISRLNPLPNGTSCLHNIRVPIMWTGVHLLPENYTVDVLKRVLKEGFQVEYEADWELCGPCIRSNGTCGSNTTDSFLCFCGDQTYEKTCPSSEDNSWSWKRKVIVGAAAAVSGILLCVIACCIKSRKQTFMRTKSHQDLEAFIQNNGPLAVKRYKFSDIRKMTNSFKDKLGQGGYGDVYKGKLQDGCLVAVKVLNASKGNGEDFINEVASISRTSHVNVVTLLGYCFEGQKKALIYEFMPNGSLEKFIYKENSLKTTPHLELEKLFEIAIGIARGLEYLHRGCNARILHFDIKPHNILLDDNFCPKISDFGLSKVFLKKESIMSMLDARGTIGYIAPEVFCRNFGGVSVKSDVYSYGMMILEVVGGRKNNDVRVSHTTDTYFPDWIYKHLEQGCSNLGLPNPMTQEENELARKMILVGLWCIQTKPSDRPSMSKVIEMLEGSIEALQIPPKPVLTTPIRTPAESESTTLSSLIC